MTPLFAIYAVAINLTGLLNVEFNLFSTQVWKVTSSIVRAVTNISPTCDIVTNLMPAGGLPSCVGDGKGGKGGKGGGGGGRNKSTSVASSFDIQNAETTSSPNDWT